MANLHFGAKRDPKDNRDFILDLQRHLGVKTPPPDKVDVFAGLDLPVYDQGQLESCAANAGALYRRFLAQRFYSRSAPDEPLSRLFLYYQSRALLNPDDVKNNTGIDLRSTLKVLHKIGICPNVDDPYDPAKFADPHVNDSQENLKGASPYKIGGYHRVRDVDTAKACLVCGYAVLIGMDVYPGFESVKSDKPDVPLPPPDQQPIGRHAMVLHGYDNSHNKRLGAFIAQNSWGMEWGLNGDCYISYDFIGEAKVAAPDMWMAHMSQFQ
jgi:C1A family cysteine protease